MTKELDKSKLKNLRPGDKFTVEFTVKYNNEKKALTTTSENVILFASEHDQYEPRLEYKLLKIDKNKTVPDPGDELIFTNQYGSSFNGYMCIAFTHVSGIDFITYQKGRSVNTIVYDPKEWTIE